MIVNSRFVDQLRELVAKNRVAKLENVTYEGATLGGVIDLCMCDSLWSRLGNMPGQDAFRMLERCIPAIQEAAVVRRAQANLARTGDDLFAGRPYEFYRIACRQDLLHHDWDDYQQRFERSLKEQGFTAKYASALCGAFNEMADNVVQHSSLAANPVYDGLVGYQVTDSQMSFAVGDTGIGVLESLRTNPKFSHLDDSVSALVAATNGNATRKTSNSSGDGFRTVFKSLADMNGKLRFRSGNGLVDYEGGSQRAVRKAFALVFSGLQVSVSCSLLGPLPEKALDT